MWHLNPSAKRVLFALAAVLIVCGAQVWRMADPASLEPQLRENGPVETAQFLAMLATGALAARTAWQRRRRGRPYWTWLAFSGFGFFVAGEEVSWGLFFLGITPPTVLGITLDSAHDLPDIALRAAEQLPPAVITVGQLTLGLLAGLGGVIGVAAGMRALPTLDRAGWHAPLWGFYLVIALIFGVSSQVIDSRVLWPHWDDLARHSFEEPIELVAALAWLALAASAGPSGVPDGRAGSES